MAKQPQASASTGEKAEQAKQVENGSFLAKRRNVDSKCAIAHRGKSEPRTAFGLRCPQIG